MYNILTDKGGHIQDIVNIGGKRNGTVGKRSKSTREKVSRQG